MAGCVEPPNPPCTSRHSGRIPTTPSSQMGQGQIKLDSVACNARRDAPPPPFCNQTRPWPAIVLSVRDQFDFARPVKHASSSSESDTLSAMICKSSRLPAHSAFAKNCGDVNQTLGPLAEGRLLATRDFKRASLHIFVICNSDL